MTYLPNDTQRLVLVGRTGSGKTGAAVWHLSKRDFKRRPWLIYDFKKDNLIARLNAEEVSLSFVPKEKHRGLFVVHPIPEEHDREVSQQLWKIWDRGDCGIFVDESSLINGSAFNAVLMQGRALYIPMICCAQRPVGLSTRAIWTEADFFQVFNLNARDDRKRVVDDFGVPINIDFRLQNHHSYYYNVADDQLNILPPVPFGDEVVDRINEKLLNKPAKRFL